MIKITDFHSERRENWHTLIQCSDFRKQFLFDRNKKLTDRENMLLHIHVAKISVVNLPVFSLPVHLVKKMLPIHKVRLSVQIREN